MWKKLIPTHDCCFANRCWSSFLSLDPHAAHALGSPPIIAMNYICRFPQIGKPPNHLFSIGILHEMNHQTIGVTPMASWKPHISSSGLVTSAQLGRKSQTVDSLVGPKSTVICRVWLYSQERKTANEWDELAKWKLSHKLRTFYSFVQLLVGKFPVSQKSLLVVLALLNSTPS